MRTTTPAFTWSCGAATGASSGVAGYSCVVDQNARHDPDASGRASTGVELHAHADKADGIWYFHVRTVDNAGNGGATSHYTVRIDTVAPSAIGGLASSTHPVQATWYANNDAGLLLERGDRRGAGSRVAGYSYVLDQTPARRPTRASRRPA